MARGLKPRPAAAAAPTPPALAHPALLATFAFAALVVLGSVSFPITDPDVWEHLAVGRAIWADHAVPTVNRWAWPVYGRPEVTPSWGFRALLWPFWVAGGAWGLAAWRWLTAALALGIGVATARRLGARGFATALVLVLAALTWRHRSQVRPETLVSVLLALQVAVLEACRRPGRARGGPDPAWWLVPIAWAWANAHLTWYLGPLVTLAYLAQEHLDAWRPATGRAPAPARLWTIAAAALAVSFVNPGGARALAQPFDFVLHQRDLALFRSIPELRALDPLARWRDGLPLLFFGWPLLLAERARRHGPDLAEALLCAGATALAWSTQRFIGLYAVVALPFAARDLAGALAAVRAPAWARPAGVRAALTVAACAALAALAWTQPGFAPAPGIDPRAVPERACDFMEREGIRGRGFNRFDQGGYLLWRFAPDRSRLPFMDIHQSGLPEDLALLPAAFTSAAGFAAMDARHRFDWVLLPGSQDPGETLHDVLDAGGEFALVFRDDAGALWVRHGGPLEPVARRRGFRHVPGGEAALAVMGRLAAADTAFRSAARAELLRMSASSPWNARAEFLLANLALLDGRADEARAHLAAAWRARPASGTVRGALARLGRRIDGGAPSATSAPAPSAAPSRADRSPAVRPTR